MVHLMHNTHPDLIKSTLGQFDKDMSAAAAANIGCCHPSLLATAWKQAQLCPSSEGLSLTACTATCFPAYLSSVYAFRKVSPNNDVAELLDGAPTSAEKAHLLSMAGRRTFSQISVMPNVGLELWLLPGYSPDDVRCVWAVARLATSCSQGGPGHPQGWR